MSRIQDSEETLDVLVNCKTYPAVSSKYIETVCTGGIARDGRFIRLYPIPFRLLDEKSQYGRWDVIRVRVYRDTKDARPESRHLEPGSPITIIDSINSESQRWEWMRCGLFESVEQMERKGLTNGLVEIEPSELYWEPEKKKWSPKQLEVFAQGNLFHGRETIEAMADRVPWQFKLRFTEKVSGRKFNQKVLAWSYYQGFRRQLHHLGNESLALAALRDTVHRSILDKNRSVFAIFGTHSRFGHWMISGLYHLPKRIRYDGGGLFGNNG